MKAVCSWCGKSMGEKAPLEDKSTTHGMCQDCYQRELGKLMPASNWRQGIRNEEIAAGSDD